MGYLFDLQRGDWAILAAALVVLGAVAPVLLPVLRRTPPAPLAEPAEPDEPITEPIRLCNCPRCAG